MDEKELIRLQEITKYYIESSLKVYSKYVVYGMIDPSTMIVRYIGNTIQGVDKREAAHKYNAEKNVTTTHFANWVRSVLKKDLKPITIVIETYDETDKTVEELNAAERRLIKEFWDMGFPLTNGTEGGELNRPTEEVRKRIGITQSLRMTPEVKAKMSEDALKLCATPEHKEKLSKGQLKRFECEEELEKNRMRAKSQFATPELKHEQVMKMNAGKATPEARKNYSEGAKRRYERPEELELNSQRMKEYLSNPENRQRLSRTIQELWKDPIKKANYLAAMAEGRSKPEAKLNYSHGQKRRFREDTEEGIRERLKNRERTLQFLARPENKDHMRSMIKTAWQDSAFRENISQKVSAANKERFKDPEARNISAKGHGGKEFVAIDVMTKKTVYKGISISMCAQMLGLVRSSIRRHLYKIRKNPVYKGYIFEFTNS